MNFRIARHTNNIESIKTFYTSVLNFEVLGSFANHDNYNGVFIGKENLNWHLEFTTSNEIIKQDYDEDDIFVFYPSTIISFNKTIENIKNYNLKIHKAKNPYWNKNGILIKDPDGQNIIISALKAT